MSISRQHEQTEIYEIHGAECKRMLAVPGANDGEIIFVHMLVGETWLRFFLDAGVLFVEEGVGPVPDEDLADGEDYIDLTAKYDCEGSKIEKASKHEDVFELALSADLIFTFKQVGDNPPTTLIVTDNRVGHDVFGA